MKILWFNWKDRKNPAAGGAEIVSEELAKRLVRDGHKVIFLVANFSNAPERETVNGYEIIRMGNRVSVYWKAYQYYKKNLVGWADLVIDEINTVPFFAKYYSREKNILFIHQLCREIWFYQMFFPLNFIGYFLEPIWLWLLRDKKVITVSESSKKDLQKFGFEEENIQIISEGIEIEPVEELEGYQVIKYKVPTILALGAVRAMKRTKDKIRAFEIAKNKIKNLELLVVGSAEGKYGKEVLEMIERSPYKGSIKHLGKVSIADKINVLRKSHLLLGASVKEGWGLIVTEANSQGTPAIVYDVDGLRDSVKNKQTGIVCEENTPENMAENIIKLLENQNQYQEFQKNGWEWSKEINFGKSYEDFLKCIM